MVPPQCGDRKNRRQNRKYIKESLQTDEEPVRLHCKTPIIHIANDPVKARKEIEELRKEKRKLQKDLAKEVYNNNLKVNGSLMNADEVGRVTEATNIMNDQITAELNEKGTEEQRDLWEVHRDHLNKVHAKIQAKGCDKNIHVPVDEALLNWSIAFLARTSTTTYKDVAKVMRLPDISYVYRKTNEMVSGAADRGYAINIQTIKTLSDRANRENWSPQARRGCLAQDSASIKAGIEHDYVSNQLIGGDESHRLSNLTTMFRSLAQKVRDASTENEDEGTNSRKVRLEQVTIAIFTYPLIVLSTASLAFLLDGTPLNFGQPTSCPRASCV